jgi:hypothetical protein
VVIEWADKFPELIPAGAWCVAIEHVVSKIKSTDNQESLVEGRKLVCEMLENS